MQKQKTITRYRGLQQEAGRGRRRRGLVHLEHHCSKSPRRFIVFFYSLIMHNTYNH